MYQLWCDIVGASNEVGIGDDDTLGDSDGVDIGNATGTGVYTGDVEATETVYNLSWSDYNRKYLSNSSSDDIDDDLGEFEREVSKYFAKLE